MSRSTTVRFARLAAVAFLATGCGNGDDSSAPTTKGDGGVTATGGGGAPLGFASTNIAYVPTLAGTLVNDGLTSATSPIYVYDFASQAFVTEPIVTAPYGDESTGVSLSHDGRTLYVDHVSAGGTPGSTPAYQVDAYALSSTGGTLLNSAPCAPGSRNVVPQPTGRVLVYSAVPADPLHEPTSAVVALDAALGTVVTPSTAVPFDTAKFSVPDPNNGNQYVTDDVSFAKNFYILNGGTIVGSLAGVVSLSALDGNSQKIVAPGGSIVYVIGYANGVNTVAAISVADPTAPVLLDQVPLPDDDVEALLPSRSSNTLYAVTYTESDLSSHLTRVSVGTVPALIAETPVSLQTVMRTPLQGYALSPDGAYLIGTDYAGMGVQNGVEVLSTTTGALVQRAPFPSADVQGPTTNVVTF